jgi:hypothetical protein
VRKPLTNLRFRILNLIPTLILFALLVSACGYQPPPDPGSSKPAPTPKLTFEQPLLVPRQGYVMVSVGLDISNNFPRSVFEQAKRKIAASITDLARPNSSGARIYINYIGANSYSPDATALVITIPSMPGDSPVPLLLSDPKPTGNPYQDAQAKRDVQDANTATIKAYNALHDRNRGLLARVKQDVAKQTAALLKLEPAPEDQQDIYGFAERSTQRFLQASPGSSRYMVLVSDMDNTTWSQWLQGGINLSNTHVIVAFNYCLDAGRCAYINGSWVAVFQQTHALSWRFLDPGQSEALSTLFP